MKTVSKAKQHKKLLSLILIVFMVFTMIPSTVFAVEVGTGTANLQDLKVVVKQNGKVIKGEDKLNTTDPIKTEISFRVPIIGDWIIDDKGVPDSGYFSHGDTVEFDLVKGLQLQSDAQFEFEHNDIKVGTLTLQVNEETNTTKAIIVFDGEESIFTGEASEGESPWYNLECSFDATFKYDSTDYPDDWEDRQIEILEENFTVDVPVPETIINGNKSGVRNGEYIEWTVKISPTQGTKEGSLAGYTFSDDLTNVGEYLNGSFKVGTTNNISQADKVTPTLDSSSLSYVFPNDTKGDRYIFFKTKIPDGKFYNEKEQTISNTAKVIAPEGDIVEFEDKVDFTTDWIDKAVIYENDEDGEIIWDITVNDAGANLENAFIIDDLDDRLDWKSASYAEWDDEEGEWVVSKTFNSEPTNSRYSFGDISSKGKLTISAKVKDGYNIKHLIQTIKNTAKFRWDDSPIFNDTADTSYIGFNPIKKRGTYDYSTMKITWTVTVESSDINDNLKVYDLLVYGEDNSFDTKDHTYTIKDSNDTALLDILKDLTPKYNQKYVAGSFAPLQNAPNLKPIVYTVVDENGNAVADLLVATESDDGFSVDTGKKKQFTFKSLVANPEIYAGNSKNFVYNTAALYSEDALVNKATAKVTVSSNMLNKDVISRVDASKDLTIAGNANAAGVVASSAYDYKDNSVVFRLHVNANEIASLDDALNGGDKLGSLTVFDELPAGWEFAPLLDDDPYIIYKAEKNGTSGKVQAVDSPLVDTSSFLNVTIENNNLINFEFTEMQGSYLILIKARPTEATLKDYFTNNGTTTITNTAQIKSDDTPPYCLDSEEVKISSNVLDKSFESITHGILDWTLEYKPNDISIGATRIEDTMDEGLQVRTNADGSLILDNITITELTLKSDGTYTTGESIPVTNENVTYDTITRKLTFFITDSSKAYRFTYKTDVVAEYGVSVSNSAKLMGTTQDETEVKVIYIATSNDAKASMEHLGWVQVVKTDNLSQQIAGVEFTLFTADGQTELRKVFTKENGKINIPGLTPGNYILRETATLDDYVLDDTRHIIEIQVLETDNTIYTEIDGVSGNILGVVNIKKETVGDLTVSKTVSGVDVDQTKAFPFTVTLSDETVNGIYGDMVFTDGVATFTLTDGQSKTATNINKNITYTVIESDNEDYDVTVNDTDETTASGTIIADSNAVAAFNNKLKVVDVLVTKNWQDNEDQDGIRPKDITVKLLADGQSTDKTLVLNADNKWTDSFKDLAEYKNGQKIAYTVEEVKVDKYDTVITGDSTTGFVITNSHTLEKVSITGTKTWNDKDNQDGKRPQSITINLMKNGQEIDSKDVTEADGWKWTFENLDKNENGKEILYSITEDAVKDYTTEYSGNDVVNSYTPGKVSVTVTKSWQDNADQDGIRPKDITVKLLADGQSTDKTLVLNADNKWTDSFKDLAEYKNGQKIAYTVEEVKVDKYDTVITGDSTTGFVITNSHTPVVVEQIVSTDDTSDSTANTDIPDTGDNSNMIIYLVLAILSLSGFFALCYKRKISKR